MPGKPLRDLARQLRSNHGLVLIPTFDGSIRCGTLLYRRRATDIDNVGHVDRFVKGLPPVSGPTPCLLAEFKRSHDLKIDALAELDLPRGALTRLTAAAKAASAVQMAGNFDSPVVYTMDLMQLETAVEGTRDVWSTNLGQRLRELRSRIVFQVFKSRLSFTFRGSGGVGVNVKARIPRLGDAGIQGEWQWRNEATLESKKEVLVAVQTARYVRARKRFVPRVM